MPEPGPGGTVIVVVENVAVTLFGISRALNWTVPTKLLIGIRVRVADALPPG